jgi:hypothetical protein
MKSSILRAGVALACALGLAACGGGGGDLYLSGTITSGVTKDGLVLTNNGGDDLAIPAGATSFQFANRVSTDDQFDIKVKSKPSNVADCYIQNGTARANYYTIAQVSMYCVIKTHNLTVQINGLTGSGLVLINGTDRQPVAPGETSKLMAPVYEDGPYGIKVLQQPAGQTCTVSGGGSGNGSGTMGSTDLNGDVVVNCA